MARAGEVVTRESLREHLWGTEKYLDHQQAINFTIRKIRAALGDDPQRPRYLETLPRVGLPFRRPVTRVEGGAGGAPPDPGPPTGRGRGFRVAAGLAAVLVLGVLATLGSGRRMGWPRRSLRPPTPVSPYCLSPPPPPIPLSRAWGRW